MGNLALHSAEEPDDLRATTGTVEVTTIRDNDAALALGARPIQQHEPAARHKMINLTKLSAARYRTHFATYSFWFTRHNRCPGLASAAICALRVNSLRRRCCKSTAHQNNTIDLLIYDIQKFLLLRKLRLALQQLVVDCRNAP